MITDISKACPEYDDNADLWQMEGDLWQGKRALVDSSINYRTATHPNLRYVIPFAQEQADSFNARCERGIYAGDYKTAISNVVGRLIESGVMPADTAADWLKDWWSENDISKILSDIDADGLRKGASYVFVNMTDGEIQPHLISNCDMLDTVGDPQQFTYAKFKRQKEDGLYICEVRTEDGYLIQTEHKQYIVDDAVEYKEDSSQEWRITDGTESKSLRGFEYLPLVRFQYSEDEYTPYFKDLIQLLIDMWRMSTELQNKVSQQMIDSLWTDGSITKGEGGALKLSSNQVFELDQPGAKVDRVRSDKDGFDIGQTNNDKVSEQAQSLVNRPFVSDRVRTATESGIDKSERDAPIRRIADMRIKASEWLLYYAGQAANISGQASIDLSNSENYAITGDNKFQLITANPQEANVLIQGYLAGAIPRAAFAQAIINSVQALSGYDAETFLNDLDSGN